MFVKGWFRIEEIHGVTVGRYRETKGLLHTKNLERILRIEVLNDIDNEKKPGKLKRMHKN